MDANPASSASQKDQTNRLVDGFIGASSAVATEEVLATALGGPLAGIAAAAVGTGVVYSLDHIDVTEIVSDFLSPDPLPLQDCIPTPNPLDCMLGSVGPIFHHGAASPSASLSAVETVFGFEDVVPTTALLAHEVSQSPIIASTDALVAHYSSPPGLIVDHAEGPEFDRKDVV